MRGLGTYKSNIGKHLEEYNFGTHLCSIYNTPQEQLSVVVPYIKIGLARHEQCIYLLDEHSRDELLLALKNGGIDVDAALQSNALIILTKQQVAYKFNSVDSTLILSFLMDSVKKAKSIGYRGLRVLAEMSCTLGDAETSENLVEFIAKLHQFFEQNDASLICLYNRNRFPSEVIEELLYIHPLIIFADMVCKNSYYIPAEEYLSSDSASHRVNQLLISMSVSEYLRQRGNN